MAKEYANHPLNPTSLYIRTIISEVKLIDTPLVRQVRNALLREMYTDIFGVDPVGKIEFVVWVRSHLSPSETPRPGIITDPITDVSLDDGFEATAEDIT